ncbi:MAG: hypothetical protein R6U00_12225 [Prochlorococcaceae cyanobacterium]
MVPHHVARDSGLRPLESTTIADRISQQRHHDWIGAFLVLHQSVA